MLLQIMIITKVMKLMLYTTATTTTNNNNNDTNSDAYNFKITNHNDTYNTYYS